MNPRVIPLIAVAVVLLGCGGGKTATDVAATVNGHEITVDEVIKVARNLQKQNIPVDPEAQGNTPEEKLYYTAVERLMEQHLLVTGAEESGLTVTDEEVAQSITQLTQMAGGEENLQKLLNEQGVTREDVQRDMRSNLLLQAYMSKVKETAPPVSEEGLRQYYDEHPEIFGPQPEVRARHLLVRTEEGASDMDKAQAKQKAVEALGRAKAGEPFEKLAEEYSEDPGSAQNGGDLGWFGKGRMVAPFDSASFALAPGEISGVVETQFGYHVIKLEETRTAPGKDFEAMKENIRRMLTQEQSQTLWMENLDQLKATAKMDVQAPTAAVLDSLMS